MIMIPWIFVPKYTNHDARYVAVRERFSKLSRESLQHLLNEVKANRVVLDPYNYHKGKMCPMGAALKLQTTSDEATREGIEQAGFVPCNIIKGVPGDFYHGSENERREDLIVLLKELLHEHQSHTP